MWGADISSEASGIWHRSLRPSLEMLSLVCTRNDTLILCLKWALLWTVVPALSFWPGIYECKLPVVFAPHLVTWALFRSAMVVVNLFGRTVLHCVGSPQSKDTNHLLDANVWAVATFCKCCSDTFRKVKAKLRRGGVLVPSVHRQVELGFSCWPPWCMLCVLFSTPACRIRGWEDSRLERGKWDESGSAGWETHRSHNVSAVQPQIHDFR